MFVCGAVCAHANPVEFEFLAGNDGNWQNGYPYYIEEVGGDNTVIMAMCDDYAHGGMPGDKWMANITNLGTGNITLTRFNIASAATDLYPLNLYDAAGWLLLETEQEPMERWLPINQAIWNIFDSQAPCDKTCEDWESVAFGAIKSLPQSYYGPCIYRHPGSIRTIRMTKTFKNLCTSASLFRPRQPIGQSPSQWQFPVAIIVFRGDSAVDNGRGCSKRPFKCRNCRNWMTRNVSRGGENRF